MDAMTCETCEAETQARHIARGKRSATPNVHSDDSIIAVMDAMTCEACEAETQARHIARGKQSATPGYHHPHQPGVRIGRELHIILGTIQRL